MCMEKFIATDKYIVDTSKLLPHIECYIIKNNVLYEETISGELLYIGPIENCFKYYPKDTTKRKYIK